jgi:hypothetical protein
MITIPDAGNRGKKSLPVQEENRVGSIRRAAHPIKMFSALMPET